MQRLLWVDVETTGLDPRNRWMLEIALAITSESLEIEDKMEGVVHVESPDSILWDPMAREMHEKNGLLKGLEFGLPREELEEELILWLLRANGIGLALAGSNPRFDREFIQSEMPDLAKLIDLNHRHFDTSTFRILWNLPKLEEKPVHRAMDDVIRDIAQARMIYEKVGNATFQD